MRGIRAEGPGGLAGGLKQALDGSGPTLIEVPVGPMPMFLRQIRERLAEKLAAGAR